MIYTGIIIWHYFRPSKQDKSINFDIHNYHEEETEETLNVKFCLNYILYKHTS